jgi:hypothetical protein
MLVAAVGMMSSWLRPASWADTRYNRVIVARGVETIRAGSRVMITGRTRSSRPCTGCSLGARAPYTHYFRLVEHFTPQMRRMLVLGGGGFSFPKYALANYPDVFVDVVGSTPASSPGAGVFRAQGPSAPTHHREDGRMFLNRNQETYDAIICDTFNSHYAIPFHLTTRRRSAWKDSLSRTGSPGQPAVGSGRGAQRFSSPVQHLRRCFPECWPLP